MQLHYLSLNQRGQLGALRALGGLEARTLVGERSQHILFARDRGACEAQRLRRPQWSEKVDDNRAVNTRGILNKTMFDIFKGGKTSIIFD